MNNSMNNSAAMSICIPRAFANITEARVRKVFDALHIFQIDHVDMVQRKNEKGELFQRIFVHIKEWSKTAEADKARERLCSGKELKIVYDDPWFWKVALNTWTPKPQAVFINDRKSRIRIDFGEDNETKNMDAATNLLSNMSLRNDQRDDLRNDQRDDQRDDQRSYSERRLDPVYCEQDVKQGFRDRRDQKDDRRPYSERRLDPVYCEQDVKQGFRDRRPVRDDRRQNDDLRKNDDRRSRENAERNRRPRTPSNSPPRKEEKVAEKVAIVTKEVVKPKPPLVKNKELVTIMQHMFRCEITDEIYLGNRQKIQDQMRDNEEETVLPFGIYADDIHVDFGPKMKMPKKKSGKIIVEEVV